MAGAAAATVHGYAGRGCNTVMPVTVGLRLEVKFTGKLPGQAAAARQVDPEAVRAARPQLVVLGDGSTVDAPGGEALERWRQRWIAPAPVVVAISPDLLQRPTPRVLEGVERLCEAIRGVALTASPSVVRVAGPIAAPGLQRVRAEGVR
jgi:hypothetical protein